MSKIVLIRKLVDVTSDDGKTAWKRYGEVFSEQVLSPAPAVALLPAYGARNRLEPTTTERHGEENNLDHTRRSYVCQGALQYIQVVSVAFAWLFLSLKTWILEDLEVFRNVKLRAYQDLLRFM